MKTRKRVVPLQVTIILAVLLCLIPPFAWLQYQWSGEVSQAEERRMRENLRATGMQFLMTFDSEVTVIHDMLEAERGASADLADADGGQRAFVEQAVTFWRGTSSWPELLGSITLVSASADPAKGALPVRVQTYGRGAGGDFAWTEFAFDLADAGLKSAILALPGFQGDQAAANGGNGSGRQRVEAPPFMYARMLSFDPPLALITRVDESVLVSKVLPALAERYFGDPDGLKGYALRVMDRRDRQAVYASPGYLDARPSDLSLPLLGTWRFELGDRVKPTNRSQDFPRVRYWLQANDRPPALPPDRSVWTLEVQRVDGSFEEAAANMRWLNLSGSLGLLVIITAGMVWLYRLYRQTKVMVRTQEDFVATVSHELKTPLSILRSAAENLREGVVTDVDHTKRYGERMVGEANRLLGLTENVLCYARLEAGSSIPDHRLEVFALDRFLRELVQDWKGSFSAQGAQLSFHSSVLDDTAFRGEKAAIRALVENLLSNALRYGLPEGGEGRVEVLLSQTVRDAVRRRFLPGLPGRRQPPRRWFVLTVRDNGKGIPKSERHSLFQPFSRPAGSPTGGIGLGLSLVRRIASAHGGRVRVEASGGPGIAFVVELPHLPESEVLE